MRKALFGLLALLLAVSELGAQTLNIQPRYSQRSANMEGLSLGKNKFGGPPAKQLRNSTPVSRGIRMFSFVSKVGGVAFGAVAEGENGLRVAGIEYRGNQPDGSRLWVTVQTASGARQTVPARIYDWELVPIAKFAATDMHSSFTLFGELLDEADTKQRRERGEKILNYHPAFEDTLLGLRLFQADILILSSEACDLPTLQGRYLLGAGESAPDVTANCRALRRIHEAIDRMGGEKFTSYVVSDVNVRIPFRIESGELVIGGDPVWSCWRRPDIGSAGLNALQDRANAEANRRVREDFDRDKASMSVQQVNTKYTDAYQRELHSRYFDEVVSRELVIDMPALTRMLSAEIKSAGGINPAIYGAVTKTMRYAALFRHLRQANVSAYEAFVRTLPNTALDPQVQTPTTLIGHN